VQQDVDYYWDFNFAGTLHPASGILYPVSDILYLLSTLMFIARLSLLLLLLLVPLVGGLPGEVPLAVFGALITFGWLGWATSKPRPLPAPFPLAWPLGVLLLVTLASTITSVYRPASALALVQLLLVAAGALLAFVLPQERRHLVYGVVAFSAGMVLGECYGLYSWYTWLLSTQQTNWRVQSTWEDANYYAEFLLICLPMLLLLAFRSPGDAAETATRAEKPASKTRTARPLSLEAQLARGAEWGRKRLPAVAAVLGLLCLVMTQSRGALLALLAVLLAFVVTWLWIEGRLTARTLGLLALGIVLFVGLALVSPVGRRVLDPVTRAKQLHSQKFRSYTWKGALRMTKAHPWLGTGPNTFLSAFGQYQIAGYTRQAHNLYLQASAETGVLGLLALLGLLAAVGLLGLQVLRAPDATPPSEERRLRLGIAAALLAAVLGLLLHGLVDTVWDYTAIEFAVLLQAALLWRLTVNPQAARPAPAWWPVGLPVAAALLTLLVLPGAYAHQLADDAEWNTKDPIERTNLYRQVVALAPWNAGYLRVAAMAMSREEAHDYLNRACALEPTNAANWQALANYFYFTQEYGKALETYNYAARLQPNYFSALYGLAESAWKAGELPRARAGLRRILDTIGKEVDLYHPIDVPEPWYTLAWYADGVLAARQQHTAAAIADFQHTLDAAKTYQDGCNSDEAKAMVTEAEKKRIQVIVALTHERLAKLLPDPAAANRHRQAIDVTLEIPTGARETPFP